MSDVRFMYFGDRHRHKHSGVIAVGYRFNEDEKCLEYSVAFCNPIDIFEKQVAHRIISARMANGMIEKTTETWNRPPKADIMADGLVNRFIDCHITRTKKKREKKYSDDVKFAGICVPRWCDADFILNSRKKKHLS